MSLYEEIENDMLDQDSNKECFIWIDAFPKGEGIIHGITLAKVYSNRVEYLEETAKTDDYAQEMIKEAQKHFNDTYMFYKERKLIES